MIECHSSASKSPWHDYVIHELKKENTKQITEKKTQTKQKQKHKKVDKPGYYDRHVSSQCLNLMLSVEHGFFDKLLSFFSAVFVDLLY